MRPNNLRDIIGQKNIKERIAISLDANRVFPHSLCVGPAGTGKTTFARAIAAAIGSTCHSLNGATLANIKDILPTILSLRDCDIVFIDEIHRVGKKVQELLYVVMEDFKLDLGCSIPISKHTIMGATTDYGLLTKPFRDRFLNVYKMEPYTVSDIVQILDRQQNKCHFKTDVLINVAKRSRGVPRIAINHFKWICDFVLANRRREIIIKDVEDAMTMIGVDANGLTDDDRRYLAFLQGKKKPVGVKTIAASLDINEDTIVNTIEPWLLSQSLIIKTQYGRMLNK